MKKFKLAAFTAATGLSVLAATAEAQTTKWVLDASHSHVKFSVTHMMISEVEGNFKNFDAAISSNGDDFSNASIDFNIDAASIHTANEMRDNHLKGDDFFNAEKFPKIKFKATTMKKLNENKFELIGDLTIRDVTKKVVFEVVYGGKVLDPYGNTRVAFKIIGSINRTDYNLKWNMFLESGGAVVSEKVNFSSAIELTKQK